MVSPQCVNITFRMSPLYGIAVRCIQTRVLRNAERGNWHSVRVAGESAPNSREKGLSEFVGHRKVASEKRRMAHGLRQCIRGLVESVTPGYGGYPLALVPFNWAVSEEPVPISGTEREVRLVSVNVAASS